MILVEDSIVRSTTMRVLLGRMRTLGRVREIHVRVACPPIIAPCFERRTRLAGEPVWRAVLHRAPA